MLTAAAIAPGPEAVDEAKTYLRITSADEEALVAGLIASSAALCEQFTGQVLVAREFSEAIAPSSSWTRLGRTPVRVITGVEGIGSDGTAAPLPVSAYAVDIDRFGDGWVRVTAPGGVERVRISYRAGLAEEWSDVPETLRQGVTRLAAHLYTHRDAAEDRGPPAAVTALWRPWRRMQLGRICKAQGRP